MGASGARGDLRAAGKGPGGRGWLVGIEDPADPTRDLGVLRVRNAAVATSSTLRRRWLTADGSAHHLIDPATGRPASSGLVAVTVVAPSAAEAEVLAKTLLLLGPAAAEAYVKKRPWLGAVLIRDDGKAIWNPRMESLRAA